jgi:hypothetical protein
MKNVTTSSALTTGTTNTTGAAAVAEQASGTTTLVPPAAKKGRKRSTKGSRGTAQERASVLAGEQSAAALAQATAAVALLDASAENAVDINDNKIPQAQRDALYAAAKFSFYGFGLGANLKDAADTQIGYGPMVRTAIARVFLLGTSKKSLSDQMIKHDAVMGCLRRADFQTVALTELTSYYNGMSVTKKDGTPVGENTLKTRKANFELAKQWIEKGLHHSLHEAAIHLRGRGNSVTMGGVTTDMDTAWALALGHSITASKLVRREKAIMDAANAKA